MAMTATNKPGLLWSRLHFLVRVLGLTGLLVTVVGLALIEPAKWSDFLAALSGSARKSFGEARLPAHIFFGGQLCLWGMLVAFLSLLVEVVAVLRFAASRRSASGFNAVVQVIVATLLLIGVNVLSNGYNLTALKDVLGDLGENATLHGYNARIDLTRGQQFTLPKELREKLEQLDKNAQTTIIVHQRHRTFGRLTNDPDRLDYAAEAKVVEKVKDLVALLREAGPRFRVEVLDVQEEGYEDRMRSLTRHSLALYQTLSSAPENVICIAVNDSVTATKEARNLPALAAATALGGGSNCFLSAMVTACATSDPFVFSSSTVVQQMSFNELYQLDRVVSRQDNVGRGNLVLLGQGKDGRGVGPFAARILNADQRRPRVGVLVVHELLSTEGTARDYTAAGLRKVLVAQGCDVRDVILKSGWEARSPQPSADTFEESKLERLEAEIVSLEERIGLLEKEAKEHEADMVTLAKLRGEKWEDKAGQMLREYTSVRVLGQLRDTPRARKQVTDILERELESTNEQVLTERRSLEGKLSEKSRLDIERIGETRRLTDLKAKMTYALSEFDMLIIPRLTRLSASQAISLRAHEMSREQAECVKEFIKQGKPVLACLGPINEEPTGRDTTPTGDELERTFEELGFTLSKHTVLFPGDATALTERPGGLLRDTAVETPPIDFDAPAVKGYPSSLLEMGDVRAVATQTHPLRSGLRVMSRSVGSGLELRLRFARPVYYSPPEERSKGAATAAAMLSSIDPYGTSAVALSMPPASTAGGASSTFLLTPASGWNDPQPFAAPNRRPRHTPPRPDDPDLGTLDVRRMGQFSVGVAAEVRMPTTWNAPKDRTARVVVIGSSDAFVGTQLDPARERLLVQSVAWSLGRDESLPSDQHEWRYPRLTLTPDDWQHRAWRHAAMWGLPLLFAFAGAVVLLYRRLR